MKKTAYILSLAPLFLILGGCGKSTFTKEETKAKIEEVLPYYIKVESFKYDTGKAVKKGEEKETASEWSVSVPITVKYKFTEPTYDITGIEPDYRKNGKEKVYFVKPRHKAGEILEYSGTLEKEFKKDIDLTEKGFKAFTKEKLFVDIKDAPRFYFDEAKTLANYKPAITVKEKSKGSPGKDFEQIDHSVPFGVPQSKMPANTLDEAAASSYKEGYENLVKNFPSLLQGQWEDNDIVTYNDETNKYIIYFKNKKYFKYREWSIDKNGLIKYWEIYNKDENAFERLVNINEKEWVVQDIEKFYTFASQTPQLKYKDTCSKYKKVKTLEEMRADDEKIRETLQGVWDTNWYNNKNDSVAKFEKDGSVIFQRKNSAEFEKGEWLVKNGFVKISITLTEKGVCDWSRWQFVEHLDKKNFMLRQVLGGERDKECIWEGSFLRTLDDDLKLVKANEELIKSKIACVFTEDFDISRGGLNQKKYSPFFGKRFWRSYIEFQENETFEHKFYNIDQSKGSLVHYHTHKGKWAVKNDAVILSITQKDGSPANEEYKYKISFDTAGNASLKAIGEEGYLFYRLSRSPTKADGTMANLGSSANLSQGEQTTIKLLNNLISGTNAAKKEFEEVKKLGNSPAASNKAVEMKKNTIPDLEAKVSALKKSLAENRGEIEPDAFGKYCNLSNTAEEYIKALKDALSKYSTIEESVDSVKQLGSKILNLF